MEQQRATVEGLANRLGRRLSGVPAHDLDFLQIIIDRRWIDQEDAKTQQAMGIVFGDLLAKELSLGHLPRSGGAIASAPVQRSGNYIFPITMISRRLAAKAETPMKLYLMSKFADRVNACGARWMPAS